MTKRVRFAGAHVTLNFTVEDEDGDVTPISTQPQAIPAKVWRTEWETPATKMFRDNVAEQIGAQVEPPEPEATNGNRQQRRQAERKKATK